MLERLFYEAKSKNEKFEGVIHFAGLKAVGESAKYPLEYWDANVNGAINLFKVMDSFSCRTIVFSSSATIYEKTENNQSFTEKSIIKPKDYNPRRFYGYGMGSI